MKKIKRFVKKHKSTLIALSVPVSMSLVVLLIVYVPSLFIKPSYDFIYSNCTGTCYGYEYKVRDGKLNLSNRGYGTRSYEKPDLFYYSIDDGTSTRITEADAKIYELDGSSESPDGFKLDRKYSYSGGFLIGTWNGTSSTSNLVKGTATHQVELEGESWETKLVGWVLK